MLFGVFGFIVLLIGLVVVDVFTDYTFESGMFRAYFTGFRI